MNDEGWVDYDEKVKEVLTQNEESKHQETFDKSAYDQAQKDDIQLAKERKEREKKRMLQTSQSQ